MIKALASYQLGPGASPGVDVILYLVTDACLQSRVYSSLRAHHPITPSPGSTLPALLTRFVMRTIDLHLSRFSTPSWRVGKRGRNYCVWMRNFPRTAVLKRIHINCKLKLQSKGCPKKIGGRICAQLCPEDCFRFSILFVRNFSRDFLTDKCIEKKKNGLRFSSACNALNLFCFVLLLLLLFFFPVESLEMKL